MRLAFQLLLVLLAASAVFAVDITTRDGKTYKHAKVTGVDADGVRITHSTGVTKVPFDNLPDEIQKEYNYDPAKVAASRKAAEEAKKAEMAQAAAAQRIALQAQQERGQQEEKRLAAEQRKKNINQTVSMLLFMVAIATAATVYFVPSIIGLHKNNAVAIFVLNFFLGWTFFGWVLALVWACTKDPVIETHEHKGDFKEP